MIAQRAVRAMAEKVAGKRRAHIVACMEDGYTMKVARPGLLLIRSSSNSNENLRMFVVASVCVYVPAPGHGMWFCSCTTELKAGI